MPIGSVYNALKILLGRVAILELKDVVIRVSRSYCCHSSNCTVKLV